MKTKNDAYCFDFEGTTLYYRPCPTGWMAFLPSSGATQGSLLLTLSRTIANWRDAGCPPSGYPKGAMAELDSEPSPENVLNKHPLEICDLYERSAIARLLKVHDIDQVLFQAQRALLLPEAATEFRESRGYYRGLAKMLLLEAANYFPDLPGSEHVELVGDAIAQRYVESFIMKDLVQQPGVGAN